MKRSVRSEAAWAKWRGLVEAQEASGLSVHRFCNERGIPASSMFAWRRRLRDAGMGVTRQMLGNFVGATQISESIFNIDLSSGQKLDPLDQWSRGLTGGGSLVLAAAAPLATMQKGAPANPNAYSTAFEMRLKPNELGRN